MIFYLPRTAYGTRLLADKHLSGWWPVRNPNNSVVGSVPRAGELQASVPVSEPSPGVYPRIRNACGTKQACLPMQRLLVLPVSLSMPTAMTYCMYHQYAMAALRLMWFSVTAMRMASNASMLLANHPHGAHRRQVCEQEN